MNTSVWLFFKGFLLMKIDKGDIFFFLAVGEDPTPRARAAYSFYTKAYGQPTLEAAKVLCGLGGDGTQIRGIHAYGSANKPFFSLNYGTSGYLMNEVNETLDLCRRIERAVPLTLSQLCVEATSANGEVKKAFSVNDVFVCNQNRSQTVKLGLSVDGELRVPCLSSDGLLIATAVGSTGYTKNVGGPVIALTDDYLVLTADAPDEASKFHSAVIPPAIIDIEVLTPAYRPSDVYNDQGLVMVSAVHARIFQDKTRTYTLLHDKGLSLKEKNLRVQFGQNLT